MKIVVFEGIEGIWIAEFCHRRMFASALLEMKTGKIWWAAWDWDGYFKFFKIIEDFQTLSEFLSHDILTHPLYSHLVDLETRKELCSLIETTKPLGDALRVFVENKL